MSDLRKITKDQLNEILKKHKAWVESGGKEGERANFSRANLNRANLRKADLRGANLYGADFSSADLIRADLSSSNFSDSDLSSAKLRGAKLRGSNLSGANLSGALLFHANLQKANFRGATFSKVGLEGADLTDADLTAIKIDRKTAVQIPYVLREKYEGSWIFLKDESVIERSIEFPPGCHEAGMGILSYFGTVVHQKYKDIKVGVTIKQDGQKVTLIVETPEGEREQIEKTLEEYGLVVTGNMKPEEFLSDPLQVMALTNKLEMAQMELRQTKQLYQFAEKEHGGRIQTLEQSNQSLKEDVQWLRYV